MNTVASPQTGDTEKEPLSQETIPESINPNQQEKNIADGGEFLDDALRMKEQPFGETDKKNKTNSYKHVCYRHLF